MLTYILLAITSVVLFFELKGGLWTDRPKVAFLTTLVALFAALIQEAVPSPYSILVLVLLVSYTYHGQKDYPRVL